MADSDGYREQLQRDSHFLCSDQRMDTELLDRLVLQLNRIYPQILTDKEAQRFRDLGRARAERLSALLLHHQFYRGLHLHAEELYRSLPPRVRHRDRRPKVDCLCH